MPKKYYILGKQASVFWDPSTKFKVVSHDQDEPHEFDGKISKTMAKAIQAGHIIEVNAPQKAEAVKKTVAAKVTPKPNTTAPLDGKTDGKIGLEDEEDEDDEEELDDESEGREDNDEEAEEVAFVDMTDDQLVTYYETNYQVSKKDLTAFKKKTKEEKIAFLAE